MHASCTGSRAGGTERREPRTTDRPCAKKARNAALATTATVSAITGFRGGSVQAATQRSKRWRPVLVRSAVNVQIVGRTAAFEHQPRLGNCATELGMGEIHKLPVLQVHALQLAY